MKRCVVFDLDDTLYPERQFVSSGFRAVDRWVSGTLSIEGFLEHADSAFRDGLRGTVFNEALRRLGVEDDPAVVRSMVRVYREHEPEIALFDDAAEILEKLRGERGLGLITDGYRVTQENKVRRLRLAEIIPAIVLSDRFGREGWKPSPKPYLKCAELLQTEGHRCIYVGDNPRKDFVTARKLGWSTVQVLRPEGEYRDVSVPEDHRADHVLESLRELPGKID